MDLLKNAGFPEVEAVIRYRGASVEKIRVSVKMYNKKPLNWEAIPVYRLE
jgi:hypothetical protein